MGTAYLMGAYKVGLIQEVHSRRKMQLENNEKLDRDRGNL